MNQTEAFTLFWNGPFSQWDSSDFKFEGIGFNRAEQFMMFCKAILFEDFDIADRVLSSNNPREQKKLGRKVQNFQVEVWNKVAKDLVYVGSHCKFTQSEYHNKELKKTGSTTLVEASPYDRVWGIGLSEHDPLALQRSTWNGKNWLGEVLTQARDDIKAGTKNESAFKLAAALIKKYKTK